MHRDVEVKPEEEEEMIKKAAEIIRKYQMEGMAILMLESSKPLVFIGGELGRFFLSPFLYAFGDNVSAKGERFFRVFEKRDNVEKLIQLLEKKKSNGSG